jgi:hypothetical protein
MKLSASNSHKVGSASWSQLLLLVVVLVLLRLRP